MPPEITTFEAPKNSSSTDDSVSTQNDKNRSSRTDNFFNSKDRVPFPKIVDGDVSTVEFIDAFEDYLGSYDGVGSVFKFLKNEHHTFIKKIRAFYLEDPNSYNTMNGLMTGLKKLEEKDKYLSYALLWLLTNFVMMFDIANEFIRQMKEAEKTGGTAPAMKDVMYAGYKQYIMPHIGFMLNQAYKAAILYLMPDANTFAKNQCFGVEPNSTLEVIEDSYEYMAPMAVVVDRLMNMYDEAGLCRKLQEIH